jgi:hypothetical protein
MGNLCNKIEIKLGGYRDVQTLVKLTVPDAIVIKYHKTILKTFFSNVTFCRNYF